jgi:hypothetical protein
MRSYIGPAQLVVGSTTCDVAVNLHEYLDLTATPCARWRGVVVNASFNPPGDTEVQVRIPGVGEAPAALHERRLAGDGSPPFARV